MKPLALEGFRKSVPAPDFSMLPGPVSTPVRSKLPTTDELIPPKVRKVAPGVPVPLTVPERIRVPLTLLIRLLRMVEGVSGLTPEVRVPDSVLFPKLNMAAPRSPMGPRPSKLTERENVKPPAVPSRTSDPPPNPMRLPFDGVVLVVKMETAPVPPSAASLLMMRLPLRMLVAPV